MERVRVHPLAWGDVQQQAVLQTRYNSFDAIVGADVLYAPEAMPALFTACSSLLSHQAGARLIFCHITRRVSETTILPLECIELMT